MDGKNSLLPRWALIGLGVLFILSLAWFGYANAEAGMGWWNIVLSSLLLALPLGLLYFSLGLLAAAVRQRRQGGIQPRMAKFIYRTPRIAAVLLIFFISLFSLDVFEMGGNFWQTLGAFVMHSLPAIALVILLALAWRWEWIGFAAFVVAALFFIVFFYAGPVEAFSNFLIFSAPMIAIGLLFWVNWRWRGEIKGNIRRLGV